MKVAAEHAVGKGDKRQEKSGRRHIYLWNSEESAVVGIILQHAQLSRIIHQQRTT